MKEQIKIGYVGLGKRGISMLKLLLDMKDVQVKTICDVQEKAIDQTVKLFEEYGKEKPFVTTDYHDILNDPEIDAVLVMTGWVSHLQISRDSVLAGKYTGVEVGCAYDITDCYSLVDAYEKTKAPLMMLENCCYNQREMTALNMVKQGLFGEVVHCNGAYQHYLTSGVLIMKDQETGKIDIDPFRLTDYIHRNCDLYPTHAFGPISKILNINRGNRPISLISVASKSRGLASYMKEHIDPSHPDYNENFKQGDIITTVITCANGETVSLELDTTLPRAAYSRDFTIRGTKGMCSERTKVFYLEGMEHGVQNNEQEIFEKYNHPLYREYSKMEKRGDHDGGMDWLVLRAFVESVKRGTQTPIDAYDTATWMAIGPLSEMSIAKGGMPVDFPDFTRGRWLNREPVARGKYCLDEVCDDPDTPIVPV